MTGRIVFVYSTRDVSWLQLARNLRTQSTFWNALQRCDDEIQKHLGWSIEKDLMAPDGLPILEEHFEPGLTAIQIGLTELWKSHGVLPAASVGVCAGEFVAAYAAGALNLESAIELSCRVSLCFRKKMGSGRMILAEGDAAKLEALRAGEGPTYHISGSLNGKTLLSCQEEDFFSVLAFLKQSGVNYWQVQSKFAMHSPAADSWREQFLQPLQNSAMESTIPYYSSVTDGPVRSSLLNIDHWWTVVRTPLVNGENVFRRILQNGYTVFLEINSKLKYVKGIQRIAAQHDARITTLPVSISLESPMQFIEETLRELDSRALDESGRPA